MESKTKTITKINDVNIIMIENGEKLVPIRPLCEALGIDYSNQIKKVKEDELLSPTVVLSTTVGADGKDREMVCLPLMFIFGWIFTINPKNVKPEAQAAVTQYKLECYKALYLYFTEHSTFLEQKQKVIDEKMDEMELIRKNFNEAKSKLDQAKREMDKVKNLTFEVWKSNNRQLSFDFEGEEEEN